jgi:hypothetical protein
MRIPLFRNSTVSISKDETVQESRTFLIDDSGVRNAGKLSLGSSRVRHGLCIRGIHPDISAS